MSGAEPWTGSNNEGKLFSGLILPEGAIPIVPVQAGPRSDRMSPNNSVLLEKRNEFGQKQFLLAPIEPNTNTIHFHDDNDSLKVPINITSADSDVAGGKKNLYAWSDQVERS